MNVQQLYNPLVMALLRSPLRGLLDRQFLILTVAGRKTGKLYHLPVNYRQEESMVFVFSPRERTWWKNLLDGALVGVYLRGRALEGWGQTITTVDTVAEGLLGFARRSEAYLRLFEVTLDAAGQPDNPEALHRYAQKVVLVQIQLLLTYPTTQTGKKEEAVVAGETRRSKHGFVALQSRSIAACFSVPRAMFLSPLQLKGS